MTEEDEVNEMMQGSQIPEDMDLLTDEELAMYQPAAPATIAAQTDQPRHYVNLVDSLDENKLSMMAQELIELVDDDESTRKEWEERVERGIKYLGVSNETIGGATFKGASKVVHPLLVESITQFQARAIQELWPSGGPVHTKVLGTQSEERNNQAKRIKDYMNYQYTEEMDGAFEEEDKMLFRLPLSGSCFKKTYYDVLKAKFISKMIEPVDFIVSYATTDLESSPRYTHRFRETRNDVLKKIENEFYSDTKKQISGKLIDTQNEQSNKPQLIDTIDRTEGKKYVAGQTTHDDRHTIYEIYVDYDLKEVKNQNHTSNIKKPYIITIDRDSQKVLRIQRNWKPDDEKEIKRLYFTHYRFTPGLGFYGYGFLHLIGGLAESATGSLRALLDSAGFSNMQGGYRSRDGRTKGGEQPLAPGEWREVNSSSEELKKSFFPIPYKEPSSTLFSLLGYLDDKARHLAGITETVTGEANPANSPVGTTAMLLEQGTKVFTAVHKRLHEAHKKEFIILADMIAEYMPDEGYPYMFGESEGQLLASDFDGRIDIVPVSDPNIASNAQRIAKAQSVIQMREAFPEEIKPREAVKMMLKALNVDNIDELIGTDDDVKIVMEKAKAMEAFEEEMRQLEKKKLETEIKKLEIETKRLTNMGVNESVDAIQAATEAAQIITATPDVTPVADSILNSSGFEDKDGGSILRSPNDGKVVGPQAPDLVTPPQESLPQQPSMPSFPEDIPPNL